MSSGDLLSIVINVAVGLYFAILYPRSLRKRFAGRPLPRGFEVLLKVVPPAGYLIILFSVIYAVSVLLDNAAA